MQTLTALGAARPIIFRDLFEHDDKKRTTRSFAIGFGNGHNILIDLDRLHLHAPEMVFDLPASGRRLIQRVDGYRATVVSGQVTWEDGEPTGANPGRLVRAS